MKEVEWYRWLEMEVILPSEVKLSNQFETSVPLRYDDRLILLTLSHWWP